MATKEVPLKQIKYAAAAMIIATSFQTKQLYAYTKNQAWTAILPGIVFCLIMIGVYSSLARRFPGFSLIEINDAVFGRIIGKVVSLMYIWFSLTIACLNTDIMGNFISTYVLPNTPTLLLMLGFAFVCGWAVRKGPSKLLSYSFIVVIISILLVLFNTALLIPQFDLKNLLPVFTLTPLNYALGFHSVSMVPLSDTFFLIMFLPYVAKPEAFGNALRKGLLIGATFLLLLVIRDTSVLGGSLADFSMPSHIAVRMINVGDILTRLDIIFISIIIMMLFYKVALLFFATVSGIQRLLKTASCNFLVTIFTVLLAFYAFTVFDSQSEHINWLISGAAMVEHTFFMVVMPLVTWGIAVLRGFGSKGAGTAMSGGYRER